MNEECEDCRAAATMARAAALAESAVTMDEAAAHRRDLNKGKKMAMGGSITDTTQATVRYIPSTRAWP